MSKPLNVTRTSLLLMLIVAMSIGCEEKAPRPALATHPVTGVVVTTGKMPVGGCVQFEPTKNGQTYVAQGVIDEQGRFALQVPYVDRVLPGATEGPHSVRVLFPLNQGALIVPIDGSFVVRPSENEFTIQIPNAPAG
jgi:hypothetical protein